MYISIIDQVCGQDGWILAKFFFLLLMHQDKVQVHKKEQKNKKLVCLLHNKTMRIIYDFFVLTVLTSAAFL